MFTIKDYVFAENLEQAYELNQGKNNVLLGGILWLKLSHKNFDTAIDLSKLGLNTIEEFDDCFKIGAMCTLRDIETHKGLNTYFHGFFANAVEHIVGVQFRNIATVGGSIFSRFAFSDVLTAFLSLNTSVELYHAGIVPLSAFVNMPADRDILVRLIIKKDNRKASYFTHRITETDFPVLACAVSNYHDSWNVVVGARPEKAKLTEFKLGAKPQNDAIESMINEIYEKVEFGTNYRGSKEYRQVLAGVLIHRCISEILSGGSYAN